MPRDDGNAGGHASKEPERSLRAKTKRPPSTLGEIAICVLTGLMLLTYITLTFLSWRQIRLAKSSLNATIEEYRLEHRAWVSLSKIEFVLSSPTGNKFVEISQFKRGETIAINAVFKNTGSTPAFGTVMAARAGIFSRAPAFESLPNGGYWGITEPGEETFETVFLEKLTPATLKAFASNSFYVYGRIDYRDAFGVPHWETFCRRLSSLGGQAECPEKHDTIDANSEIRSPSN